MSNTGDRRLFTRGPRSVRDRLNRMREDTDSVLNYNLRSTEFIRVQHVSGRAQTISLNLRALLRRIAHIGSGGGSGIRWAYPQSTPSSGSTVDVYLDTDATGEQVTVSCKFYDNAGEGGSFADEIRPKIEDGVPFQVVKIDGTWWSAWPFYKVAPCTVS